LPAGCNPDAPLNLIYTVTEIYPEHVVLDGNHPLAGIALRIHLHVAGIREATEEEQAQATLGIGFFGVGLEFCPESVDKLVRHQRFPVEP